MPHLDHKPYDPTMRVGLVLVYSKGEIDVHFIASYWKLPMKSLTEKGTLTELHRSCGEIPYYAEVSNVTQQKVQKQLSEMMPHMFEILLK